MYSIQKGTGVTNQSRILQPPSSPPEQDLNYDLLGKNYEFELNYFLKRPCYTSTSSNKIL